MEKRQNALLFLGGIVFALTIAEVGLRLIGFSYPNFFQLDAHLGLVHRPNAQGWFRNEGESYVRINADGLRSRNYTTSKPENTFRIAVLGDSFVEAFHVPEDKGVTSVLQKALTSCGAFASKVEVLNFGVSGYGTGQELLMLRRNVWKYEPDLVVLAFFSGNDLRNNVSSLEHDPLRPYFLYRDEALVLDDSFHQQAAFVARQGNVVKILNKATDYSRLAQLFNRVRHAYIQRESAAEKSGGLAQGLDAWIYRPPQNTITADAWNVTEQLLGIIAGEVQAHGAGFLLVSLTNPVQVHPDRERREAFLKEHALDDLFYPDQRIKDFAKRSGFDSMILAPLFQSYADSTGKYLHGFEKNVLGQGHWNENGHRIAGETIAEHICRRNNGSLQRQARDEQQTLAASSH